MVNSPRTSVASIYSQHWSVQIYKANIDRTKDINGQQYSINKGLHYPLSTIDRISKQKFNKETVNCRPVDLTKIYRAQ